MGTIQVDDDRTYQQFIEYADVHFDGDESAAVAGLVLCHKMTDLMISKLVKCQEEIEHYRKLLNLDNPT